MRKQVPSQQGFTLAEALVVAAVISIVTLIAGVQVANFVNKANLEGASTEVRTFLESARTMSVKANSPITVHYDLVNGNPVLQLVDVAGTTRSTYRLAPYVRPGLNQGTTAPGVWPTPAPGDLFTCDTLGRAVQSGTTRQVTSTQTFSITHRGMLDESGFGSIRPRIRYDVQVFPVWNVNVTKTLY